MTTTTSSTTTSSSTGTTTTGTTTGSSAAGTPAEGTRTVLVTGSTSGIGAATTRALAAQGWHVVVTGRDAVRGESVVADVEAGAGGGTGTGRAVFVPSDLSAPPQVLREFAAAAVQAAGGRLDALVHNAALCPAVDTVSLADADLEAALAVNVRAPHVLTAALAPAMAERGHGAIVVLGSWMAHVGHPFVGLYSATKAAEVQLARSWAAEFGPRGVRVNTVSPGATRTPVNASAGDVIEAMTAGTPAGRPGTPQEVAEVVAWVLSERAGYVHGAEIAVDGGITATRS
ncbi:SDR family NAD(P)-dependent oxidoreductase [Kineococcus sp. SYSU DK005]|uniref:SDR family NAD(P)-dependent oxidoreductase n=1 Tax=Kineococcus sp. SYSU DK005 TaxID=3383126 RepID=UPI003D7D76BF